MEASTARAEPSFGESLSDLARERPAATAFAVIAVMVLALIAARGLHEVAQATLNGLTLGVIYALGAVGYVNPYGNYIPRASWKFVDWIEQGRWEDAKQVQRLIDRMQHIIGEGHPTYGHQCYSKALARVAGYPVGDVRPPLTTFADLGEEGEARQARLAPIMAELDALVDRLDAQAAAAE